MKLIDTKFLFLSLTPENKISTLRVFGIVVRRNAYTKKWSMSTRKGLFL